MRYFFLIFQQCVMLKQHICFLKSVLFGAKIALKFEIDQVRYTWITTIITAAAVSKLLEKLEQKIDFLSKAKQQLRCCCGRDLCWITAFLPLASRIAFSHENDCISHHHHPHDSHLYNCLELCVANSEMLSIFLQKID